MRLVPVEITPEIEASLVEAEWLDLKNLENAQAVGEAVGQLLSWWNKAFGCNADTPFDTVTRHASSLPTRGTPVATPLDLPKRPRKSAVRP